MNERISDWLMHACMHEWINKWMNEWMNASINDLMHEWMNRKATNETMKQSINEWGNQWMKPWKMIQSMNQRVSESMNESMSGLMKWKRNEHEITWNEMNPMSEWENEWASEIQYSTSSIILLALQNICIIMYNIYIPFKHVCYSY